MNKILSYGIPIAGAIGITLGIMKCDPLPTKEVPATVTIKDVYYAEFKPGVNCLYRDKKLNGQYDIEEAGFELEFTVKINDPNLFRYVRSNDSISSFPLNPKKVRSYEYGMEIGSFIPDYDFSRPLTFEVVDWQGNVTRNEFLLEDIIKKSKQFKTIILETGKECPKELK